ncbi:ribonucleoside-diphosphate reductase protein [Rhizobium phage RHph_I72]|nr:ribonucleoside-diphosphate reductase protein [Rhizobium phage RHph_I65]QIG76517.1 ribonucleoside-diphosphate reductase protein [Rhizobium phage RHph_I72]
MGPQTRVGEYFHAMKYRSDGETFRESNNRVAAALKDSDEHYHAFREITGDMRFMPGGRIQGAMGAARATTPYNCYVSGRIEDSFVHGDGSIMQRATEAAATMRMGGGIGYDFSTLRPRGSLIRKLQSHATGPISFMEIFDAICGCVSSSGHRRGAQMGVLRVDHPDIEEFLHAKQNTTSLTNFNISIAITDEFMHAVRERRTFHLRWGGEIYKEVDAANLWEAIMRSTWDWAEPGVLFIDRINELNNLRYCEEIAATNPCGEQPLPPHGACLLGSFNLAKYVKPTMLGVVGVDQWVFDYDQLIADIPHVVRAMDNVVDRARYPLPEQEAEAKNKRRMGLGVTGLANAGEALGFSYGSEGFLDWMENVLRIIAVECYRASALLAKEKGAFPLCDERLGDSPFIQKLPEDVRELIEEYGLRNSHLTSIAPTGTISLTADNVSSGCEPVFDYVTSRPVNTPAGQELVEVEDYGLAVFGVRGKRASEVTAQEHIAVLTRAQKWVDSAVSKTCNMDSSMSWDDFKALYMTAWEGGAKGCTTFNIDGKRMALLTGKKTEDMDERQGQTCEIDPVTGRRDCA